MSARRRLDEAAESALRELAEAGLERRPVALNGSVDLVSNDYLALRRHPAVVEAARRVLDEEGVGAGAARLLGGSSVRHERLEAAFAEWQHEEAAVSFPTGTAANHGALAALLRPGDLAISDAFNHASLVDGIRLSGCRKVVVPHADPEAVDRALGDDPGGGRRFVILEGVYSMEGDRARLAELAEICRRRDALLVVDEAHSLGLLGPDGGGAVEAAGCADVVAARVNPCGKALGTAGGVVTCSSALASLIVNRARAYMFTTALPPAVAAAATRALELAREESWRRERALGAAARFRAALAAGEGSLLGDGSAIVPWVVGAAGRTLEIADRLRQAGFAVHAVRPPTVPEGTSRIRFSFHADLEPETLTRLIDAIGELEPSE